jgi:hypothetical protein
MKANPARHIVESLPHGIFSFLASRIPGVTFLRHEIEIKLLNEEELRPDHTFRFRNIILIVEWKCTDIILLRFLSRAAENAKEEALYYRLNLHSPYIN